MKNQNSYQKERGIIRQIVLIFLVSFTSGCATLVQMPQKYPAAYAAMEETKAAQIVRECFNKPECEVQGKDKFLNHFYSFWISDVSTKTFSFKTYRPGKFLYSEGIIGYGVYTEVYEREYYTVSWPYNELSFVFVYLYPRGDYRVSMTWQYYGWSTNEISLYASKADLPRLLLALSKLAPQAIIRVVAPSKNLPETIDLTTPEDNLVGTWEGNWKGISGGRMLRYVFGTDEKLDIFEDGTPIKELVKNQGVGLFYAVNTSKNPMLLDVVAFETSGRERLRWKMIFEYIDKDSIMLRINFNKTRPTFISDSDIHAVLLKKIH